LIGGMKATELLDNFMKFYGSSALAQDLVETGTGAAISATGQALFTDMTPQEILLSSVLGAGAAMAARPVSAEVGRFVGRRLPESWNESLIKLQKEQGINLPLPTKQYLDDLDEKINILKQNGAIREAKMMKSIRPVMESKYNAEFKGRTPLEGLLGYGARLYGDNASQALVALAMPSILNSPDQPEGQSLAQH
jgi:hypothetical protein